MLNGQKKDRRTVYDQTVRLSRKAVQAGKNKKANRRAAKVLVARWALAD